jgi:virulence factor Mce-like protein
MVHRNRAQNRGSRRTFLVLVGVAAAAFGCLLAYIGYKAPDSVPGRGYYNLQAEFLRADNLAAHYQVRIKGRLVGQVLHPRVRHGHAVVDLQLEKDVKPLLSDTRLRVRPRSAIGVRFVELTPGTRGRPLSDDETIPARATSAALPLDIALGTLDARRRVKLKTLLDKLGAGTAGRGEDLNAALGDGPRLFADLDAGLGPVNRRPGAVEGLVTGLDDLSSAAAPVREDIARGFRPEADALRPLSEHAAAVRSTLSETGPTLAAARDQLPPTAALLAGTAALARTAEPTLRLAPRAFTTTSALLGAARPSLRAADATLHLARRAVGPTLGLLRTLRPVLPAADDTFRDSLPLLDNLGRHRCDLRTWTSGWGEVTEHGNSGGQFLRLTVMVPRTELFAGDTGRFTEGVGRNPYPKPCEAGREPRP